MGWRNNIFEPHFPYRTKRAISRGPDCFLKSAALVWPLLISIMLLAFGTIASECQGAPRVLRDNQGSGYGFDEFEFLTGGRLICYYYAPPTYPDPKVQDGAWPFMLVEVRKWKMDGERLWLGRNNQWLEFGHNSEKNTYSIWNTRYFVVDDVRFFKKLAEYCGDSNPANHTRAKVADSPSKPDTKPPFHFLRAMTDDGTVEYEFQPDGTLFAYYEMNDSDAGKKPVPFEFPLPRFEVKMLKWSVEDGRTVVSNGTKREVFTILKNTGEIISGGVTWHRVDHLVFLPNLYKLCDRPLKSTSESGEITANELAVRFLISARKIQLSEVPANKRDEVMRLLRLYEEDKGPDQTLNGHFREAFVGLLRLGDPKTIDQAVDDYDNVAKKSGTVPDGAEVKSGYPMEDIDQPLLIPRIAPHLFANDGTQIGPISDDGVIWYPASVGTGFVIAGILQKSDVFDAATRQWAKEMYANSTTYHVTIDAHKFREAMITWWNANKDAFEKRDYKSVRPGPNPKTTLRKPQ